MSNATDADLEIALSTRFQSKVLEKNEMLAEIEAVTKSKQTRGRTFAKFRDDLDLLIESGSALYERLLGTH